MIRADPLRRGDLDREFSRPKTDREWTACHPPDFGLGRGLRT